MFERLWKMSSKQILGFSVLIIIVLTGITLLVNTAIINFISDCQLTRLGQVGDSFGSLNALLNFATIAILIYTISQQRREKKESDARYEEQKEQAESHFHDRKKLDADHHAELKDQAQRIHDAEKEQIQKNFDEQKKYLRNQEITQELKRFENTFFKLLELHAKNRISFNDNNGLNQFAEVHKLLLKRLSEIGDDLSIEAYIVHFFSSQKMQNIEKYKIYFKSFCLLLDLLRHDLDKIEDPDDNKEAIYTKYFYIKIISSQMLDFELELLLFFSLTSETGKKLFRESKLYHPEFVDSKYWFLFNN